MFETGFAIAHAIAWNPEKQEVACAAQAVALSSEHITFKSNNLEPLQQDLVLELERALNRNFVAVGDAPPKLERPSLPSPAPSPSAEADTGAPPTKKSKKPKR